MLRSLAFLLLTYTSTFGQLKPGAIGVVYLEQEVSGQYSLSVVFPLQMMDEPLSGWPPMFALQGSLQLFDEQGPLGSIQGPLKFRIQQWCDNDGGQQSRPTLEVTIDKRQVIRELRGRPELQEIACFVVANPTTTRNDPAYVLPVNSVISGDYDNDGRADCFISTYYDEAENCDGQPVNHLGINLNVDGVSYVLRCCGP